MRPARLAAGLLAAAGALAASPGHAAEARGAWPAASIRLVFAAEADAPAAVLARLLSHRMVEALGQQVYLEPRPGEGGRLAAEVVATASGDGLAWLAADEGLPLSALRAGRAFDLSKALQPVTQVARRDGPLLAAHPSLPARSLGELQALAAQKGRTLESATGGADPSTALAAAALRAMLGPALVARPLASGESALPDLLAGRSLLAFVDAREAEPSVRSGRLRALAVAGPARLAAQPTVPTFAEAKVPGIDVAGWHGLWLPASTPPGVAASLQAAVAGALQRPGMADRLAELGYQPVASTPAAFAAFLDGEVARLRVLATRAGWPER